MSEELEKRLRRLVPVAPSARLDEEIRCALERRGGTGDRLLRATVSLAMAASVVIVALLATDNFGPTTAASPASTASGGMRSMTIADTPRLLAQVSAERDSDSALRAAATNPN